MANELSFGIGRNTKNEILNKLNILIILDGFDELKYDLKERILDEYNSMCAYFTKSKIILTSRLGELESVNQFARAFQICPMTEDQIDTFIFKWMSNNVSAKNLKSALAKSPLYDTAIRPLTLAHICTLFEKKGRIPNKSTALYDKIINLLLEEWDEQRNLIRESKFDSFEIYEKKEVLSALSFYLTSYLEKSSFNRRDLIDAFESISGKYRLPIKEVKKIVSELESHTGLLIRAGYDLYQFSHKSLQEFLAAEYISRLPDLPHWKLMSKMPSESALLVSISSNSVDQFAKICSEVIMQFIKESLGDGFLYFTSFIERLFLESTYFQNDVRFVSSILNVYTVIVSTDLELLNHSIWKKIEAHQTFISSVKEMNKYYIECNPKKVLQKRSIDYHENVDQDSMLAENKLVGFERIEGSDAARKYLPNLIVARSDWASV